jgi:hypothetical protein
MTVTQRVVPIVVAWMLIVEGLSLHAALAGCTSSQRRKMDREGLSGSAIDRICGERDEDDEDADYARPTKRRSRDADDDALWEAEDRPQPGGGGGGQATFCVTSAGGCQMVIPGQRGGVCTCITPMGAMYGIAR